MRKGKRVFPIKYRRREGGIWVMCEDVLQTPYGIARLQRIYLCYTVAGDSDDILLARRDLSENTTKDEYIRFTV